MNLDIIRWFLSRIEQGYYQVVDSRLHRNGKPLGNKQVNGYISHGSVRGRAYAHRILFAYYHGIDELAKYESINHKDGNKENNTIENLEGMSKSENTKHQWDIGLSVRGSRCSYAKLDEVKVLQIKRLLREGISQYEIARMYNVSRSTILNIKRGTNWAHVKEVASR